MSDVKRMRTKPLATALRAETDEGGNEVRLSGLAIPWDTPTRLYGSVYEEFAAGAIDPAVAQKTEEYPYAARLNLAHDTGRAIASVEAGTLSFVDEEREVDGSMVSGLFFDAVVDVRDPDAQSAVVKVEREDYTDMSIEFALYVAGYEEERIETDDRVLYRVKSTPKLWGVAVLAHGAYPQTDVALAGAVESVDHRRAQERAIRKAADRDVVERQRKRSALRRSMVRATLS